MSDAATFAVGDRIRMVEMPGDPDPVAPGTEGTVVMVQHGLIEPGQTTLTVDWDNGRALTVWTPPDRVEKIDG